MSVRLGPSQNRLVWFTAPPLLGLLIGVAVAIVSSPSSLGAIGHGSSGVVQATPTPLDVTPPPSVTSAGVLGNSPRVFLNGASTLIALGPRAMVSSDGGKSWTPMTTP